MSKNGKADYSDGNDDREDVRWFESYERRSKTKHLERLRNEDILNYIQDVKQNCRLEVSSGDEDYAGTRKSSNCSVRCSGTRFRSFRKSRSRLAARKHRSVTLRKGRKRFSSYDDTSACNYCSARKSHFRGNSNPVVQENSGRYLNTSTINKSICQRPNLSRNSKCPESSSAFYGWYSRRKHKMWPAVTKMASLEVTADRSRNADRDSGISRSKITDRKSARVHTFKSPRRRNELGDSCYVNTCSSVPLIKKRIEETPRYRRKHKEETRKTRKSNEEGGVGNFKNQQLLNKIYSGRGSGYPAGRPRQPPVWGLSSRSNRLTSTRLPETSSLLRGRTSQWDETEIGPPLRGSSSIMRTPIDRSRERESRKNNNTKQWRRQELNVLRDRESSCCRRLSRESGKLCGVVSREDKQWLGNAERDETAGCSRYCCCLEKTNGLTRLQHADATSRPAGPANGRASYTAAATLCGTLSDSTQQDNDERESEISLSIEGDLPNEGSACEWSFLDDRACRDSIEAARGYKESSFGLKSSQEEARGSQRENTAVKEHPFAMRTPGKLASEYSSGLRYEEEPTCECKEPLHDPPAACLAGSCTCVGNDEDAEGSDSDSSRRMSDRICCCCPSSFTSRGEKNPVKKLESFCERVKAVNQNVFRSRRPPRGATRTRAREYVYGDSDRQDQSEFGPSVYPKSAIQRSVEGGRPTDPGRPRLERLRRGNGGANLERILIYPPRGEGGPPLTLYKRSSNISCRVKGDADTGFRYSVTYVQKFVSPTWMPSLECDCSADYG